MFSDVFMFTTWRIWGKCFNVSWGICVVRVFQSQWERDARFTISKPISLLLFLILFQTQYNWVRCFTVSPCFRGASELEWGVLLFRDACVHVFSDIVELNQAFHCFTLCLCPRVFSDTIEISQAFHYFMIWTQYRWKKKNPRYSNTIQNMCGFSVWASFSKRQNRGCTSSRVYVPCIYTHDRWELP